MALQLQNFFIHAGASGRRLEWLRLRDWHRASGMSWYRVQLGLALLNEEVAQRRRSWEQL